METKTTQTKADENNTSGKKKNRKLVFIGLGALAVGVLSYFGWNYWKDHSSAQENNNDSDFDRDTLKHNTKKPGSTTSHKTTAKKQTAGNTSTKQTNSTQQSKTTQEKTSTGTASHKEEKLDAANIAFQLAQSANRKEYLKTVTLLNHLKNTGDYSAVNSVFKTYRVNGVRQTLVNALLSAFKDAHQKLIIKAEFLRIGLKHNITTDKWSLSGIEKSKALITTMPTRVWKSPTSSVNVPKNMVLGHEVARKGNHTLFENEQEYYIVPSAHIKHHRS
jgi:predicted negative regulator of RcsB-dependent stress response